MKYAADIREGQCYRLVTGRIVRVFFAASGYAACDIYNESEDQWMPRQAIFAANEFSEACDDPLSAT